jgi:hypothetical protein
VQSKGLSSVVPFVPFGCSSRSFLPPFHRHFTAQKNKAVQPKRDNLIFPAVRSSSSHVLFPTFGGATASTIPLHYVTLRKLRSTTFQQYHVCRPSLFQRLLFRTAIGFGSAPFLLRFPFFGNPSL